MSETIDAMTVDSDKALTLDEFLRLRSLIAPPGYLDECEAVEDVRLTVAGWLQAERNMALTAPHQAEPVH